MPFQIQIGAQESNAYWEIRTSDHKMVCKKDNFRNWDWVDNYGYGGPFGTYRKGLYEESCCLVLNKDYIIFCATSLNDNPGWTDSYLLLNGQKYCEGPLEETETTFTCKTLNCLRI